MSANSISKIVGFVTLSSLALACSTTSTSPAASPNGNLGPGFSLEEGDAVVENANVSLTRTYWSVVRSKGGTHYLLPRPDGATPLARECETGTALAKALTEHSLCAAADGEGAVQKVNALDESLALEVSTILHRELSFERSGDTITPSPLARDVLALCETNATLREGAMKERCAEEAAYADGGPRPSIFRMWTEAELAAVPAALNELYGVKR